MANTKTATKRARQSLTRNSRNQTVRSATKSSLKLAIEAIQAKDPIKTKIALQKAIQTLSKAASKGAIPKTRAARKISRLTLLVKKTVPTALTSAKA